MVFPSGISALRWGDSRLYPLAFAHRRRERTEVHANPSLIGVAPKPFLDEVLGRLASMRLVNLSELDLAR